MVASESSNPQSSPARSRRIRHGAPVSHNDLQQFRRQITKDEWRATVLPARLKKEWEDESGLYQVIKAALRLGFAGDVDAASTRLIEIDSDHERSHVTRGVVLMRMQRFADARQILREHADTFGPTRIVLTCLAKAYDEAGESAKSTETLLQALSLPQWSEASLAWWSEIQRDLGGETAHIEILRRAAAIRGSWMPSLWNARHNLKCKDIPRALSGYKQSILGSETDADVLAVIAGDLVKSGLYQELVELSQQLYDPARHGPLLGLSLLRCYLEIGDVAHGETLLEKMRKHFNADLRDHLDHYALQLQRLAAGLPLDFAAEPGSADRELFVIDENNLNDLADDGEEVPIVAERTSEPAQFEAKVEAKPDAQPEMPGDAPRLLEPCLWLSRIRN